MCQVILNHRLRLILTIIIQRAINILPRVVHYTYFFHLIRNNNLTFLTKPLGICKLLSEVFIRRNDSTVHCLLSQSLSSINTYVLAITG